jgi:hypothetical protein
MTIQELAKQMFAAFEKRTRNEGAEFWCLKDDSPEWMDDVCPGGTREHAAR